VVAEPLSDRGEDDGVTARRIEDDRWFYVVLRWVALTEPRKQ
jgi:hypothetical protein